MLSIPQFYTSIQREYHTRTLTLQQQQQPSSHKY